MSLDSTLREAGQLINGPRMEERGSPHELYHSVAVAFTALKRGKIVLKTEDIYLIMRLVKEAREQAGHNPDNMVDLCGYAAFTNDWLTPEDSTPPS